MTDTQIRPHARPPRKRGVQIEINAGVQPPERWKPQLDLLRSAGASFDEFAKRWHMILTEDQLTAAVLDKLFYAAAEYGARITVRAELAAEPPAPPPTPTTPTPWWRRQRAKPAA
jgi:hypothetical protein